MNRNLIIFSLFLFFSCSPKPKAPCIYDYTVNDINGNKFDFATLEGKKIIIVNTASNCGFAEQYGELEELYQKYKRQGLEIVAFPSNDFNNLEPGTNEEIEKFCKDNYNVSFWLMEKSHVKGKDMVDIYKYLTKKSVNNIIDSKVGWNFQKYLIDEEGYLVKYIPAKVSPLDTTIVNWIVAK
jgi:glutathione peroxidase